MIAVGDLSEGRAIGGRAGSPDAQRGDGAASPSEDDDGSEAPARASPCGSGQPLALWERAFLIGALLDQQDAFLNVARVLQGKDASDQVGSTSDPLNVILVALTLVGLAVLILRRPDAFWRVVQDNVAILALCFLIFVSPLWSIAAGLSAKRAFVHFNTILLALYMACRLDFDDALEVLAQSIGIAAIGSFIAGAGFHKIGVMHTVGLEGKWRGVYSHKNPLAQAMGLGAMLQAYFVIQRRRWRDGALFLLEVLLIGLSNSITVLFITISSLAALSGYFLIRRIGVLRRATILAAPMILGALAAVFAFIPTALKGVSGRDASLSGRTELWSGVMHAISLRPLVGYGYQSFWDGGDPLAMQIWTIIKWNAPNSHNGVLEVLLGLGAVGLAATLFVMVQAFVRAARLLRTEPTALAGVISLILLGGIVLESFTEAVLVRQGDIDWLTLNLASFVCLTLWQAKRPVPLTVSRFILDRARPLDGRASDHKAHRRLALANRLHSKT